MASKGFECVQKRQRRWIPDPLYGLPISNYPDVIHRDDSVEKRYEAFFMMRLSKPCGMVEQTERRPAKKRIELRELAQIICEVRNFINYLIFNSVM